MKLKPQKFERLMNDEKALESSLKKTRDYYRSYDPGQYLYNILINRNKGKNNKESSKADVLSDDYLELVYTTLIAWNMNGRAARLNDFESFKNSIRENEDEIRFLQRYKINELNDEKALEKIFEATSPLIKNLDLVGMNPSNGKKIRSKLVAFSKTMHFMLPELMVPIDRKYTLNFFYNTTQLATDVDPEKNNEKQIGVFNELYNKFWQLSQRHDLTKYFDDKWNRNVPKVIDNAVIGSGLRVEGLN